MKRRFVFFLFPLSLIVLFAGILLAQKAQNPPGRPLIVNGKAAGNVFQMDGRSYVDLDTLAQVTNGSVTLETSRVVLTIPTPEAGPAPAAESQEPASAPSQAGLTRNFAGRAIGELAEMREWRGAIGTILTYNVPVVGTWPQDYLDRVQADVDQLSVYAATPDDEAAMSLVRNEFSMLANWASNVVATRQNLDATNTVRPDALQSDATLAKISDCSRFLSSMLVSGTFADKPSCH